MKKKILILFVVFILGDFFTSCQQDRTCASAISELLEKGCTSKQLSKVMGVPESIIRKPEKHTFSEADSIFLFSLLCSYNETGKLPDNLYQLYQKNKRNQVLEVIENLRKEEIKSNELFINSLCQNIIETQNRNINDFIESEVNSLKSLRFIWKSQDEINQALSEALPKYVNEIQIAKIYNDSCASYINYIARFRDNGVKRYLDKSTSKQGLHTIETDIRGFTPEYQFENSSSHVTYQVLATIERAQDVLFKPINWLLELLPNWLMITVSIILLIILIISFYTGQIHVTILDGILLIISIILFFWSDPYSDIRESINDQIQVYYENKIKDELTHLNIETNKYYDNLIKTLNPSNNNYTSRKSSVMQTCIETNDGGNNRTNHEKDIKGGSGTERKDSCEVISEEDSSQRNQTPVSTGD